jgi:sensor histidine kinase YesM
MELDELKAVWAKEQQNLESRLVLNEKLIRQLSLEKSQSSFTKLLEKSILGRNLAFFYGSISLLLAIGVGQHWAYSVPACLGGFAMFFSFFQHISLKKPDISLSAIALQKAIAQFRIHTAKHAKYDGAIVLLWLATIIPVWLYKYLSVAIYASLTYFLVYLTILVVVLALSMSIFKNMYAQIDKELAENADTLATLSSFEKE